MAACQKLDPKTGMIQGNDSLLENTEGQTVRDWLSQMSLGMVTFD